MRSPAPTCLAASSRLRSRPRTGPKIRSAAAVVPTASSSAPMAASVGPSCLSVDRGTGTTAPTTSPLTSTMPTIAPRRAGPPSPNPPPNPRPRFPASPSLLGPSSLSRRSRPRFARPCRSALAVAKRARTCSTTCADGSVPSLDTTRPSLITTASAMRPSYSCRRNCSMSSLGSASSASPRSRAARRMTSGGVRPGATSIREISQTTALPCTTSSAARNNTNPRPMRQ